MTWVCQICGYEIESDEAPESCPVCGAESDAFEKA
jgi:rubrerythrin